MNVELEWIFVKFCDKKSLFPLLLVEILIFDVLFSPKTQNIGQMYTSNHLWSVIQKWLEPDNSGLWKLNYNGHLLITVEYYPSSFVSGDINL